MFLWTRSPVFHRRIWFSKGSLARDLGRLRSLRSAWRSTPRLNGKGRDIQDVHSDMHTLIVIHVSPGQVGSTAPSAILKFLKWELLIQIRLIKCIKIQIYCTCFTVNIPRQSTITFVVKDTAYLDLLPLGNWRLESLDIFILKKRPQHSCKNCKNIDCSVKNAKNTKSKLYTRVCNTPPHSLSTLLLIIN